MEISDPWLVRNSVLSRLQSDELSLLAPHLKKVVLESGAVLTEPSVNLKYGYFITDGLAAISTVEKNGRSVQNDIVGREGFVGIPMILAYENMPASAATMLIAGSGLRVDTVAFRKHLDCCKRLSLILRRYVASHLVRVRQTTLCNPLHSMEERLACQLLLTCDRIGLEFKITHDMVAQMVGSRRVSVTLKFQELQRAKLISYKYSRVRILNSGQLARLACECYQVNHQELDRFLRI